MSKKLCKKDKLLIDKPRNRTPADILRKLKSQPTFMANGRDAGQQSDRQPLKRQA